MYKPDNEVGDSQNQDSLTFTIIETIVQALTKVPAHLADNELRVKAN